ncbi:uncharacterized protein VP01_8055g1, partial [Puccinia sorghi]
MCHRPNPNLSLPPLSNPAILPPHTANPWVLCEANHFPPSSSSSGQPSNTMDTLNAHLDKLMRIMGKEHAQRLATEETLQKTQARLDTMAGQQNSAPTQPNPAPAPASNPMRLWARLAFMLSLNPRDSPPMPEKCCVLFMRDYAATWSQLYRQNPASLITTAGTLPRYLLNLCQTGTVSAYMQDFNQHARTVGWADTPLMSLCQHGLKENIQLAVVMSNI